MEEMSTFMYDQMKIQDYMVEYVIAFDQPLSYVEDKILEWMIQNNVQLAIRRIPRSILRSKILRNHKLIKLKVIIELNNFNCVISISCDI